MDTDHTNGQAPIKKDSTGAPSLSANPSVEAHPLIPTDGTAATLRQEAMSEFGITYDGRSYQYNGYQYERLADALAYAKLVRSEPLREHAAGPFAPRRSVSLPTVEELGLMGSLGISFEAGTYRFKDFRYDELADALNYARLNQ